MADQLQPVYAYIFWSVLESDEERYVLYDFVLSLPEGADADKMVELRRNFRVPGTWQSLRVPAIAIMLVMGVFLFTTQPEISTFLAVLTTSLTTILVFVWSSFGGR